MAPFFFFVSASANYARILAAANNRNTPPEADLTRGAIRAARRISVFRSFPHGPKTIKFQGNERQRRWRAKRGNAGASIAARSARSAAPVTGADVGYGEAAQDTLIATLDKLAAALQQTDSDSSLKFVLGHRARLEQAISIVEAHRREVVNFWGL